MKVIITGGAGFIGSAVIRQYIQDTDHEVVNLDALTYAGNLESLVSIANHSRYHFERVDIRNIDALKNVLKKYQPDAVMHLAAKSHVNRSIEGSADFIRTNIVGTYDLLDVAKKYWDGLESERKNTFRFYHVSTDEVYGDLGETGLFTEDTEYQPSSIILGQQSLIRSLSARVVQKLWVPNCHPCHSRMLVYGPQCLWRSQK